MTWCERPPTAVMTLPEHMWAKMHHVCLEEKEEGKKWAACRPRPLHPQSCPATGLKESALLRHHVLAGVDGADAQLGRAQQLHSRDRDAPEHPAPGLVVRRGRLAALDLRAPPRLAAVQAQLAADHAPTSACPCGACFKHCTCFKDFVQGCLLWQLQPSFTQAIIHKQVDTRHWLTLATSQHLQRMGRRRLRPTCVEEKAPCSTHSPRSTPKESQGPWSCETLP